MPTQFTRSVVLSVAVHCFNMGIGYQGYHAGVILLRPSFRRPPWLPGIILLEIVLLGPLSPDIISEVRTFSVIDRGRWIWERFPFYHWRSVSVDDSLRADVRVTEKHEGLNYVLVNILDLDPLRLLHRLSRHSSLRVEGKRRIAGF